MRFISAACLICLTITQVGGQEDSVDQLVAKLGKAKTVKDKVAVIEAIGKLGEQGTKASDLLCQCLLNLSPSIRTAGIEALEKVRPDLYKHLVVLVATNNPDPNPKTATKRYSADKKMVQAINELGLLGEKAGPVVPILFTVLRSELANAKYPDVDKDPKFDFAGATLSGACFDAVEKISPNDPETQRIILVLAGPTTRFAPARAAAIKTLGRMSEADPTFRKRALPVLSAGLGVADPQNRVVLEAIRAVARCGPDAKDAIPVLKKLKLSSDEIVREAANAAIDKIEAGK